MDISATMQLYQKEKGRALSTNIMGFLEYIAKWKDQNKKSIVCYFYYLCNKIRLHII